MAPKKSQPSPSEENNEDLLRFPDPIRALIAPLKFAATLLPSPSSVAKATLGPTFASYFPDELAPYYPLGNGENLLLNQAGLKWTNWNVSKNPLRGWRSPDSDWRSWARRIEGHDAEVWKHQGIAEAIRLSTKIYDVEKGLIAAAACFWSQSSNSLLLNFGMISPTILDVAHLTGLPILGNPIHALLEPPKVTFTLNTDMCYTDFAKKYQGKPGSPVDDKERTAFYLLWLCEFLFCVPGYKITKEYLPLALCMQDGQLMALAPYLLATLYKALFSFVDKKISGNCGGPFWLFQAWLYAYFPEARPPPPNTLKPVCYSYAEQLLTYNSHSKLTFTNHLTMFYNLPSQRPSNLYMPFQNFEFSSSRLRFLFTDPSDLHNEQVQEQNESWRHILTCRHVLVGCSISSAKLSSCSFETYCPNQWSRQFGLSQAIPYPYFHPTIHEEIGSRIHLKDPTQAESILTENTKLFQDFGPFFFKPASDCSAAFDHWWGLMTAIIFCKPLESCLNDTCIHIQGHISSPSKLKATGILPSYTSYP